MVAAKRSNCRIKLVVTVTNLGKTTEATDLTGGNDTAWPIGDDEPVNDETPSS